ncbi:hypothetical protein TRFO_25817 [Tritrichomonas foetus]|uniref:Uncharacterized protein n=1 Tax=Tritrichomonas foetus TaxID=1144522 RepID=A0A1J4K947_9EUKA|nr:hypothetical protein TRFO_25817 [Tritrichomonas foetus]|eukprot:OHT06198.1 hypothetical protein TRFO_25817 [Tritrichomonas foetus]
MQRYFSLGYDYDYEGEDTVTRVQKYLIDKGKFQMNQTLVLQDDEIARLRKRLRMLKQQSIICEEKVDKKRAKLYKKRKVLKHRIHEIRTNKTVALKEISDFYSAKRKRANKRHQRELSYIDETASSQTQIHSKIHDETETEMMTETINSVNRKIDSIRHESISLIQENEDHTSEILNRYQIQIKTKKKRCEELQEKIKEIKEKIEQDNKKKTENISQIKEKEKEFEKIIQNNSSQFDSLINSFHDKESGKVTGKEEMKQIKKQIQEARKASDQLKSQIMVMKTDFKEKRAELRRELVELQNKHDMVVNGQPDRNYDQFIYAEEEFIEKLKRRINGSSDILQQLREENLELHRKLNECDYILHGRTGNYQRFNEITKVVTTKSNHEEKEENK